MIHFRLPSFKTAQRPIQLRISGTGVKQYANNGLSIDDVTELARAIPTLVPKGDKEILLAPSERVDGVNPEIERVLAIKSDSA